MRLGTILVAVLVVVAAVGALAVTYFSDSEESPKTLTTKPAASRGAALAERSPASAEGVDTSALAPATKVPGQGPSDLDGLLAEFDAVWAAPATYQDKERYEAIARRNVEVEVLAQRVADLGDGVLPEIKGHLIQPKTPYPRRMFLAIALSQGGSEGALRLLAEVAVHQREWRLRQFAFKKLVESESDAAMDIALETLPKLGDPRFLIPPLKAGWDPEKVEQAYRRWLGSVELKRRTMSYSYIGKIGGNWVNGLLREVAASDGVSSERAGAIGALSTSKVDGTLLFFRDLLWDETDTVVIRALVAAILKLGGKLGQEILLEYLAQGPPEEVLAHVERAATRSIDIQPVPLGGGGGGAQLGSARVNTERMRPGQGR